MFEGKIVKTLIRAGVGDTEEVPTGALSCGLRDIDNNTNSTITNKVTNSGRPKGEDGVWPVIVVVIAPSGFIIDKGV